MSAAIIVRGRFAGATPKILEIGTLVLFAVLAAYQSAFAHRLSLIGVRLCVDFGLLAIVLISIAVRSPFTMQYAREQVPRHYWTSPVFLRVNYTISAAWAVAFAAMVIADAALLYVPGLPQAIGIAANRRGRGGRGGVHELVPEGCP